MARKAMDGTEFTNQMSVNKHNSSLKARGISGPPAGGVADGDADPSQQQPSIEDNPEAMQCVDKLKQLGYTADDVAQAMQDDGGASQGGAAATAAAPMQIPGMQ